MMMLGNKVLPAASYNRISFVTVIFASTLLYYHWEAMVISYLAVKTTQLPIITLQDLIQKSNLKVFSLCLNEELFEIIGIIKHVNP